MKQQGITPKIIELAKAIAKYWRMEIYEGCWILNVSTGLIFQVLTIGHHDISVWDSDRKRRLALDKRQVIPIPTISDCLLKLHVLSSEIDVNYSGKRWAVDVYFDYDIEAGYTRVISKTAKHPHVALLSALLEVLKNE